MKVPRKVYDGWAPPVGWLLSEKYDGYRARWMPNENHFLSRNNKVYTGTPDWFLSAMPDEFLDGELFAGRENFQDMGVVRKRKILKMKNGCLLSMLYMIYRRSWKI